MLKKISNLVLHKILFNITEYNKPDLSSGKYILCPNHTSNFDGPIFWASHPQIRIMAKKELFDIQKRYDLYNKMFYEGKKNFYCSNRDCGFSLWRESRYLSGMRKQVDKRMAQELLSSGRTRVTDFYSQKTGKDFTADLLMEVPDGRVNFKLEFPKKKGEKIGYGNRK